jgi:alcohol dehydrogenase class IV
VNAIQVNEELFSSSEYFADPQRLREAAALFKFEQRRVVLGPGALDTLAEECRRLGARTALLLRDPGVAPLEGAVRQALEKGGVPLAGVYDQVESNPSVASVDRCAAFLRETRAGVLIALGGGSAIDTAKAASCVAEAGGSIADYVGFDLIPHPARLPLVALPTTAGTGSEASRVSVVAEATGTKAGYSDHLTPRAAIVDPQLSAGMPPGLTAITGLDAIGHALECTASTKSNPLGDAVARESLRAGCPHLVRAIEKPDPEARYQMARCSLLAGLLLSPINTGAAHALGYGIEKLSHERGRPVPHGAAVALMLPGVMRHNLSAAGEKYYYTAGVAGLELAGCSREEGARLAAGWIDALRRDHTPFASLREAGLGREDIPALADIALAIRRLLDYNPVALTREDAFGLYEEVMQ